MEVFEQVINKYHICDSRGISQLLPDEDLIDVTITSPPYWNLKDYGNESQIGFGQDYEKYLDDLEMVFRHVYSITKKTGKCEGEIKLLPFDLAQRLKRVGWRLQDIIIWNKDRTLPWSHQGKLRNIFEYITFYSKGRKFNYHLDRVREISELKDWWIRYPERYSPEGKAPARVWDISIPRQGSWGREKNWVRHFNPLPPELAERILLMTTDKGNVVLDPFCGSGTVLAQAHVMGRKYIGLDLNQTYKEMFEQRVLPAINILYEQGRERTRQIEKRKERFGNLIRSMRMTKYPKELAKLYERFHGPLSSRIVAAMKNSASDSLDIIFLFPCKSQIPSEFLSRANEISKRPPLSKYGIQAIIAADTVNTLSQEWLQDKGLDGKDSIYLYTKGRMYAWDESITIEKCLELVENGGLPDHIEPNYLPVVISNIGVKVDREDPFSTIEE